MRLFDLYKKKVDTEYPEGRKAPNWILQGSTMRNDSKRILYGEDYGGVVTQEMSDKAYAEALKRVGLR